MTSTLEPAVCCAPLASSSLSDEEAAATAELFKALGDPARVRLVNLIATNGGAVCQCDLIEPLGLSKRDAVEKLAVVADLKGVCC